LAHDEMAEGVLKPGSNPDFIMRVGFFLNTFGKIIGKAIQRYLFMGPADNV